MIHSISKIIDGWMNPIHVKELRQVIKAKAMVGSMLFILSCMVVVFYVFIQNMSVDDERVGAGLFSTASSILSVCCVVFLPIYLYFKTGSERNPDDLDLMYITKMQPGKIILGKYATGLSLLVFFVCIFMPFMAFSYVLKGIDLVNIFITIAGISITSCTLIQLGLLFGSLKMNGRSRTGLAFFIGLAVFMFMSNGLMLFMGPYSPFAAMVSVSTPSWTDYLWGYLILILWWIFVFILNRSILMPPMANRAFAPRLSLSIFWVISLAVVIINDFAYITWFIYFYAVSIASLLFSMGERDSLSKRVRKNVPTNKIARFLAFFFYSGSVAGIIWSVLMIAATVAVGVFISMIDNNEIGDDFAIAALISAFSIFGYSMFIYWITRLSNYEKTRRTSGGIAFAFIMILAAFIAIVNESLRRKADWIYYFSPFCGWIADDKPRALLYSIIWAVVTLFLIAKCIYVQVKDFKPLKNKSLQTETLKVKEPCTNEQIA